MTDPLNKSLLSTVANSELKGVAKTSVKVLIDSFLRDGGLAEQIPIVNLLIGTGKAARDVREHLFLKKVLGFLQPVSEIALEDRQSFFDKLDDDEKQRVAQYMVLYIERLDSLEKPEMLGKIFASYVREEISYKTMLYFCYFVDRVFIITWQDYYDAIKEMVVSPSVAQWRPNLIHLDDARALETVGFYTQEMKAEPHYSQSSGEISVGAVESRLTLSDAGLQFIQTVFGFWIDARKRRQIQSVKHALSVEVPVENP